MAAYKRHLRHGETPCDLCRAVNTEKSRKQLAKSRPSDWKKRELAPCGTTAAYARHLLHNEKACEACLAANRAAVKLWQDKTRKPRALPVPCGSYGAYKRHKKNGEEPCDACKTAMRTWTKQWADENREHVRRERKKWQANHPEHNREQWQLKRYGISLEEKRALFASQSARCAIGVACDRAPTTFEKMATDHCHNIHRRDGSSVRGICCQPCNKLLGIVGDDLDGIRAFRSKLDTFEHYLTHTFPETQRRLAAIRGKRSL